MLVRRLLRALAVLAACSFGSMASAQRPVLIPGDYAAAEAKTEFQASGPTLLFSDSPEMVYRTGILYRDCVEGTARLFFHHVNASGAPKRLAVMVKNTDQLRPVACRVERSGVGRLSYNYLEGGKEAQQRYFDDSLQKPREEILGFGRSRELLSGRGIILAPNQLLTGMLDLRLSAPAQLSVLLCEPKSDLEIFNESAQVQPIDEHPLRGTFADSDWHYRLKRAVSKKAGPLRLKLAGPDEGYARGVDAATGLPAENYGNYGVVYHVSFKVRGDEPVSFILNPLGGAFAGYGVLQRGGDKQLLALPEYDLCLGEKFEEAAELALLEPGEYTFIWSPPGASNLPVELIWR